MEGKKCSTMLHDPSSLQGTTSKSEHDSFHSTYLSRQITVSCKKTNRRLDKYPTEDDARVTSRLKSKWPTAARKTRAADIVILLPNNLTDRLSPVTRVYPFVFHFTFSISRNTASPPPRPFVHSLIKASLFPVRGSL